MEAEAEADAGGPVEPGVGATARSMGLEAVAGFKPDGVPGREDVGVEVLDPDRL